MASTIEEENGLSFWDALIVRSAQELGCTIVWSEDLNDGQHVDGIQIRNPFADGSDARA